MTLFFLSNINMISRYRAETLPYYVQSFDVDGVFYQFLRFIRILIMTFTAKNES